MTIHLYTICWNEAYLLDFFFRHYDPWIDRYVIYDDGSDDDTAEILQQHPRVEVRRFRRTVEDSFVASQKEIQNEVWKESRGKADWVVVTAIDEHLELAGGGDQRAYLDACSARGVTLVPAIGYQMVSRRFPHPSWRLASRLTLGAPFAPMNKLSIFNPGAVDEAGFAEGRHRAWAKGALKYPESDRMMLLHYKYMDFERTFRRHQSLKARLGSRDIERRWGVQYHRDLAETRRVWEDFERRAINVAAARFVPGAPGNFDGTLWWRAGTPR